MGDWSQKADADVGKSMGDRPAGSPVEPCATERKIESVFVPPESVALASNVQVPEGPGLETQHTTEADPAIETAHSTVSPETD